jgi:hypothetical protein
LGKKKFARSPSQKKKLGMVVVCTCYPSNASEGLKDRPQEVKETLLLRRKCLFASERHLLPSGNANRL